MNKNQLKKAYKESKQPMGIYSIKNSQNDIIFIGYALDLNAKINRHQTELKFDSHRNKELQHIWNTHGESALEFEIIDILEYCENVQTNYVEELNALLEIWGQKMKDSDAQVLFLK